MPIQVAFEGPIAAGKTTWAKLLAPIFAAELVLEEFETNDYLADYYQEPARWAFPMQLWFLTARHEQLSNLDASSMLVADYGFFKEEVFSRMLFNGRDLRLYSRIRKQLGAIVFVPRFLVFVDADTPTLLRRIRERGRDYESTIDAAYLDRLRGHYEDVIGELGVSALRLDTSSIDLASDEQVSDVLMKIKGAAISC